MQPLLPLSRIHQDNFPDVAVWSCKVPHNYHILCYGNRPRASAELLGNLSFDEFPQ